MSDRRTNAASTPEPASLPAVTAAVYGGLRGARVFAIVGQNPQLLVTDPAFAMRFWLGVHSWLGAVRVGGLGFAGVPRENLRVVLWTERIRGAVPAGRAAEFASPSFMREGILRSNLLGDPLVPLRIPRRPRLLRFRMTGAGP